MRFAFVSFVVFVASFTLVAAQSADTGPIAEQFKIDVTQRPAPVYVLNFPDVQAVAGTVSVDNLPAVQNVGGTVNVGNLPALQPVSGTVTVGNLPLDPSGALRVGSSTGKFIGVTTATYAGTAGWRNLSLACNTEFGAENPTARMCTSRDIVGTPVPQWPSLTSRAWVQPVIVAAAGVAGQLGATGGFVDISGFESSDASELSCNAWSGSSQPNAYSTGLVLMSNGGFNKMYCTAPNIAVTCCTD